MNYQGTCKDTVCFAYDFESFPRAGIVVQWVKSLLGTQVPVAPLLIHLPADVPWRAVEYDPSAWAPITHLGDL